MIIFADYVPDNFIYNEKLDDIIIWRAREDSIEDPYKVDEYQCRIDEERNDFLQSLWDMVCDEYDIHTLGMTNEVAHQVTEVDEVINKMFKPITAFDKEYDAADVMFVLEPDQYNCIANAFVGSAVTDIIDSLLEKGTIVNKDGMTWKIVDKTVDECIEKNF